jgi:hypothetical protein
MQSDDVADQFSEKPHIEFVMLADHAEAINGKLYMNGGGWTDHNRPVMAGQAPPPSAFSIALSVFVPWADTNRPIDLTLLVEDDDGNKLVDMTTQMVVGRSPILQPGSGQHAALAINAVQVFPKAGGYRVVVKFGDDMRTWPFRVIDIPQQQQQKAS